MNTIQLIKKLISFKSVTPEDNGAIIFLSDILKKKGFKCKIIEFGNKKEKIKNLYAYLKNGNGPNLCFAGHTDVVPPGDKTKWKTDPFSATLINNFIYGRGVTDMKGAIIAFYMAVMNLKKKFNGTISFLITGDEEGEAEFGTKKVIKWLKKNKVKLDFCIVGEPTNPNFIGEMIKIGRRGSLNGILTVFGKQGHVAYPDIAKNPIPYILNYCQKLIEPLNDKNKFFQNSNIEITSIDVDNHVTNIIPESGRVKFNARFNNSINSKQLITLIRNRLDTVGKNYRVSFKVSGESFHNCPKELSDKLSRAIHDVTGKKATLSTNGGTSDARFISNICPVLEFGLISKTMHQANERVKIKDIEILTKIYERFCRNILN